jgi:hypothetical protein
MTGFQDRQVSGMLLVLLGIFALGLTQAWELLGVQLTISIDSGITASPACLPTMPGVPRS